MKKLGKYKLLEIAMEFLGLELDDLRNFSSIDYESFVAEGEWLWFFLGEFDCAFVSFVHGKVNAKKFGTGDVVILSDEEIKNLTERGKENDKRKH